jgi:hypothetical protein
LCSAQIVLRSKTPELVEQEFWGLLMAHYAIRGLKMFHSFLALVAAIRSRSANPTEIRTVRQELIDI